jgi:hypothetical protein
MFGRSITLIAFLAAAALLSDPAPVRADETGTYLGLLVRPPVEMNNTARPVAPAPAGVRVTHVLPDSPAAKAGLRANDLVLAYGKAKVRDCEHLARLIRADKPDRKVRLLVLRDKKELTLEATLALGPVLKTPARGPAGKPVADGTKVGGVSVFATPLENGKMNLKIEYYKTGRLQTVTCNGAAAEIANAVRKLPERERNLVRIALQRLRALNTEKIGPPRPVK